MTNTYNILKDAFANKTIKYLSDNFPGKKLVIDKTIQESKSDIWGFNTITIFVKEIGNEIHFKTNIKSLNQYLS